MELVEEIDSYLKASTADHNYSETLLEKAKTELLKHQWISVKERLPETNDFYLGFEMSDGLKLVHVYSFHLGSKRKLYWRDKFDFISDVTHWIELPEPPNE